MSVKLVETIATSVNLLDLRVGIKAERSSLQLCLKRPDLLNYWK